MVSQADIQALCTEIAAELRPARIILFGSYAWGAPTADSDVDIFIVASVGIGSAQAVARLRARLKTAFPLDLVLRTPEMVDERLALGDPFVARILRDGKTLYEAAH